MKIYPPVIPPPESPLLHREISDGERKIFEAFKTLNGFDDWFVIHSLLLPDHKYKLISEIDFVLVGPLGLFCLEVKGTKVTLDSNGIWDYGYAKSHEGPFKQASSSLFSLLARLKDNFRFDFDIDRMLCGYGVIFTRNTFDIYSIENPKEIILDSNNISSDPNFLSSYINRLTQYWQKKKSRFNLSPDKIDQLRYTLRPEFEIAKMLKYSVEITDENFTHLTKSQYKALDYTSTNERIIFDGGAGTGKTFLAMEAAKRHSMQNHSVLFLCYNPLLAAYLNQNIRYPNITVISVHAFFYHNLMDKKNYKSNPDFSVINSTLYTASLPEDFVAQNESANSFPQYDVLIIDEAQDLLSYPYLVALDYCLLGGWSKGKWLIFLDSKNQIKLQGVFDSEAYNSLKILSPSFVTLTENCRNTTDVIRQTKLLTGLNFSSDSKYPGLCSLVYYDSPQNQYELIHNKLKELLFQYQPGDITLLSDKPIGSSVAHSKLISAFNIKKLDKNSSVMFPFNNLTFCSPWDFKGLENRIIIYMDIDKYNENSCYKDYVSITRARYACFLFIDRSVKSTIQEISIKNLELISE